MPGISLVHRKNGIAPIERALIGAALGSAVQHGGYRKSTLVDGKDLFLGATRHSKYPVTVFESGELFVCVEGRIYGKPPGVVRHELLNLSPSIFAGSRGYKEQIVRWLFDTDGDYIVFILHKPSGELCIFNDALARLPLFYHNSGGALIVSREPRFITNVLGRVQFDRESIAQYLLFGYPLGDRTVFSDIHQMFPASIIRAGGFRGAGGSGGGDRTGFCVDGAAGGITVERLHRHNFEDRTGNGSDVRGYARDLAGLFEKACRDRHDQEDRNIVALSSGMDSRMVASCLARTGLPFSSETFRYDHFAYEKDVRTAKLVAGTLGCEWKLLQIEPAMGKDVLDLLRMKDGLNFLGMSFSLPLFRRIREAFGERVTLFTGDGGDKVLRDIRPAVRIGDMDGFVKYVVAANQLMPIDLVAETAHVRRDDIVEGLRRHFESYDERDLRLKYVHFLICERCMKWLFHGEDRNRCAFWQAAPMYSIRFFERVMDCPFEFKKGYRLYREMLVLFSREAADIVNTEWNLPVTSSRLRWYWMMREIYLRLPVPLRKFVRSRYRYHRSAGGYPENSDVMRCFFGQSASCAAISEYLSIDAIRRNLGRIDRLGFDHLFTLTSMIEDFTGPRSSIEDYFNRELI